MPMSSTDRKKFLHKIGRLQQHKILYEIKTQIYTRLSFTKHIATTPGTAQLSHAHLTCGKGFIYIYIYIYISRERKREREREREREVSH